MKTLAEMLRDAPPIRTRGDLEAVKERALETLALVHRLRKGAA
jgi:hypothetical protein